MLAAAAAEWWWAAAVAAAAVGVVAASRGSRSKVGWQPQTRQEQCDWTAAAATLGLLVEGTSVAAIGVVTGSRGSCTCGSKSSTGGVEGQYQRQQQPALRLLVARLQWRLQPGQQQRCTTEQQQQE